MYVKVNVYKHAGMDVNPHVQTIAHTSVLLTVEVDVSISV